MTGVFLLLLLLSALCFLAVSFGRRVRDFDLLALGLLFFVLVPLIQTAQKVW